MTVIAGYEDHGVPRVSPEAFRANLIEMIERARRFQCKEIILSTNHTTLRHRKLLSGEPYEAANAHYSEILRSVAKTTGVVLCDIRPIRSKSSPKPNSPTCCCRIPINCI